MNKLSIRPARAEDCQLILKFIYDLARYEKLENEVFATEEELRKHLFGKKKSAEVFLGFEENIPVCFALVFQNFSTFAGKPGLYLEDLFVDENYRNKGYGKTMLQYLAKIAHERNYGRFEWAVLDWNKSAIDFYKGLGAKAMDQWTIYRMITPEIKKLAGEK